jgi:Homing endonuclease associated repeat
LVPQRVREMYELYQYGATLDEVGEDFGGLSRERIRQLFGRAGLKTRSAAETAALKRAADRRRGEEIVARFRRSKDVALVAEELEIAQRTIIEVVRAELPLEEYRAPRSTVPRRSTKRYSDEELIGFLRKASAALETTLSMEAYDSFARGRRTADGRRWPTRQTPALRFGSWRAAVIAAGLDAHPTSGARIRLRFTAEDCAEAVRAVGERVGGRPSQAQYERRARASAGELPSASTLKTRCGGWGEALRMAYERSAVDGDRAGNEARRRRGKR